MSNATAPFASGTDYVAWYARNCDHCAKHDDYRIAPEAMRCPIQRAIEACQFGEPIPADLLARWGYTEGLIYPPACAEREWIRPTRICLRDVPHGPIGPGVARDTPQRDVLYCGRTMAHERRWWNGGSAEQPQLIGHQHFANPDKRRTPDNLPQFEARWRRWLTEGDVKREAGFYLATLFHMAGFRCACWCPMTTEECHVAVLIRLWHEFIAPYEHGPHAAT